MIALSFAAYLFFGVVLVLVGSNQAELARDLGLDLARSGLLAAAPVLGIGVGVVGVGPLVDRQPRRPLFVAGCLIAASSLLLVDAGMGFPRALLQFGLAGVGIGVHETLLNATIGERYGARSAKPLVFVHSAATLGGMLAPLAIGWVGPEVEWTASFRVTGGAELAVAAASLLVRFPDPPTRSAVAHAPLRSVLSPGIVPFALIGFAYVGLESALTIFAVPYAVDGLALGADAGRAAISALWLGLLLGRLLLLVFRREIDAGVLLAAGLSGGVVLAVGVGAGLERIGLFFALCGMTVSFVFPVMIALAGQRFPEAQGTATGLVAGIGCLGGLVVPWLHGGLGDRTDVTTALGTLAVWPLVIAVSAWAARRSAR